MGKSTLINLLVPQAAAQVGEISQALNTGRHTTTTTTWYWLDAERRGALIDSPGFQEFGLRQVDAEQLAGLMPDLRGRTGRNAASTTAATGTSRAAACARRWSAATSAPSRYRIYEELHAELSHDAGGERAAAQPTRLASVSSASSSIHSTTERQTRPTTLRRWPGCGGTPAVEPGAPASSASRRLSKVLERSGVTPGAAAPPSCTPTAPAAAARMMPSLGCCHSAGVAPPAVDGLLEIADHGEAEGRQPRRHVVDQREQALRRRAISRSLAGAPSARLLKAQ